MVWETGEVYTLTDVTNITSENAWKLVGGGSVIKYVTSSSELEVGEMGVVEFSNYTPLIWYNNGGTPIRLTNYINSLSQTDVQSDEYNPMESAQDGALINPIKLTTDNGLKIRRDGPDPISTIQLVTNDGLTTTVDGIGLNLSSTGGLEVSNNKLH